MLTIFANMLINSPERLEHLKDSFESFSGTSDDWLINIRGKQREAAIAFLKERLGDKATFFELLDDSRGWSRNALDMLARAKHPYVLIWVEDHINIAGEAYLRDVVREMDEQKVESLCYSWHNIGWEKGKLSEQKALLPFRKGRAIDAVLITKGDWERVQIPGRTPYLVSLISIFKKDFFKRLLLKDRRKLPFYLTPLIYRALALLRRFGFPLEQRRTFRRINRVCGYVFPRFPKETPFDVEKGPDRFDILPMRIAFPSRELFACIDDDMDSPDHSYSLVSRGRYPVRDRLIAWNPREALPRHAPSPASLAEGDSVKERYCFYDSVKHIRATVAREHIAVISGRVRVLVGGEALELAAGEGASYFTNVSHEVRALETSEIIRYIQQTGLAPHYFSA